MNKRINIVLPETTLGVLDRLAGKGGRSSFIDEAVCHYVRSRGRRNLRKQLVAGCIANAERDLEIAAEWFPLEEEAHETMERHRTTVQRMVRKRA